MNNLSNEEAVKTDKIYHGCYGSNTVGTRILKDFMNGEHCLLQTAEKYWKNPQDVKRKLLRRVNKTDFAQKETTKS